jgi:hypothetical protein
MDIAVHRRWANDNTLDLSGAAGRQMPHLTLATVVLLHGMSMYVPLAIFPVATCMHAAGSMTEALQVTSMMTWLPT